MHSEVADGLTLGILRACWVVFMIVWLVAAFFTKRTVRRSGWWWRILFMAIFIFWWTIARSPAAAPFLYLRVVERSVPLDVLCAALGTAGLLVMLWARATIGRNWSGSVVLKEDHELVTSGPYAFVRHPIYTGLLMLGIATALFYRDLLGFLVVLVGVVAFGVKIQAEERLMTETFPDQYPEYRRRVKGLVPYVF